jgi:hypothetical protein
MKKLKKSESTTWSHHETMMINLKEWVSREINYLRNDINKETPALNASASKLLKSAEDMNVQLFDTITSVIVLAEKIAKTKKQNQPEKEEADSFEELDA